jgi:hypothetical protein
VGFKETVNAALRRTTGYQLQRQPARNLDGLRRRDRLVDEPVFILCSVRSGSTLLRVLLNTHSQIHSPHEMHLRAIQVKRIRGRYPREALRSAGLDEQRMRDLLWRRLLDRELEGSGKRILVNKTPSDVFIVDDIVRCWPRARFIFLLRHPAAIATSRQRARPQDSHALNIGTMLRYGLALERARRTLPGLTVRYEDLTADPEAVTRGICAFLGVPWERRMLDYGRFSHGAYAAGLGDWSDQIKSGRVQPPRPLPEPHEIPVELVELARDWDYLPPAAERAEEPGGLTLGLPIERRVETA